MDSSPFVSYAPNREDVVLYRALRDVSDGHYVDIGTAGSVEASPTYALYERGWSGITVEPAVELARQRRAERPRDLVVGTPEAGRPGGDLHCLVVALAGTDGGEHDSVGLEVWKPWVVVVQSPRNPQSQGDRLAWQQRLDDAGYSCCLFDGVSRFFVAAERKSALGERLSVPANVLDGFVPYEQLRQAGEVERVVEQMREHDQVNTDAVLRWRAAAIKAWATTADAEKKDRTIRELNEQIAQHVKHVASVDEQLAAIRGTMSWRVTKPLRSVRRISRRAGS